MKLSDLKTGETGVIVKVLGHGGFRKRIIEMGFIQGKQVEVLLNAPLRDPVKYKIMGYEVSLRHSEADQIEVISAEEARQLEQAKADNEPQQGALSNNIPDESDHALTPSELTIARAKSSMWHSLVTQTVARRRSSTLLPVHMSVSGTTLV